MSETLTNTVTPTFSFNEIPSNLQTPGDYVEITPNYSGEGLLPFPARGLLIGQMLASAPATAAKVYTITQAGQAEAMFGAGSPVALQINAWLAAKNGIPLDVAALNAPEGATAASGLIAFGGAATAAGSQPLSIVGNRISFVIAPGDTLADMATNFIAAAGAIANANNLPVSFATNGSPGQVVVTASCPGALGNLIDIRVNPARGDMNVPGVTVTITPMSGGAGSPDITPIINATANTWYTDISCAFLDTGNLLVLIPALAERYTAMQTLDSQAWLVTQGSQGAIASFATGGSFNSQFAVLMGVTNFQQPAYVVAAALCAVAAQALMNDPARQLRSLVLPGIIPPADADVMFEPAQNALILDGVATFDVTADGSVAIQRAVTTYLTTAAGVPDTAWQDVMTPKVMTRIRYDWNAYCKAVWPRNKLAPDGSLAAEYDSTVATPKRLKASWAARCQLYEQAGWIENSAATAAASTFAIDPNNRNRVNAQLQVQIIGNLMIDAQQLQFDV